MAIAIASLELLRIPVTILHVLALSATSFRLYYRHRYRNLWWDDGGAAVAAFLDILYLITFWLRSNNAGSTPPSVRIKYIVLHWFSLVLGPTVLWLARISITTAINRVVPPWRRLKLITAVLPFFFMANWSVVVGQRIWICTRTDDWHSSPAVTCFLGQPQPTVELCLDLLADSILVCIPLKMLWNINIPPKTRRFVLFTFATSMLTSLANIVYIVFMYGSIYWKTGIMVAVTAHIEAAVSLMVCNLLVILPCLYRLFNRRHPPSFEDEHMSSYWGTSFRMVTNPSYSQSGVLGQSSLETRTAYDFELQSDIREGRGHDVKHIELQSGTREGQGHDVKRIPSDMTKVTVGSETDVLDSCSKGTVEV